MRLALVALLVAGCNSAAAPPNAPPVDPVAGAGSAVPAAPAPPNVRPPAAVPVDANPASLAGKEMYGVLCAPCHGKDLKGYAADNAPSLISQTFLESAPDSFLAASISTGRPGTSMAAYSSQLGGPLDPPAIARLVEYIRSQGPAAKPLPAVKLGDVQRGAGIYAKACESCHGDQNKRRDSIHLANSLFLLQASNEFIHYAIAEGRPGTKMNAWKAVLSAQEINDVTAFVRSYAGKVDPPVTQLPAPTGKEPLFVNPKGKPPTWKLRADRFVSVDEVAKAYKAGAKMVLLDARPPSDWMRSHLKGAISIPHFDTKRIAEIPKDAFVVTYCACPHHLSGIVFDELRAKGHKNAAVLDEGINDWHRKGYPMTVADGVKPPPEESPQDHSHHGHAH